MRTSHVLSLSIVLLAAAPFAQKRAKSEEPLEFPKVLEAAQQAWSGERYGTCIAELQRAIGLALERRAKVLVAALPAAPEGWSRKVEDVAEQTRNNPLAAGLVASVGSQVTAHYRAESGGGRLDVTVHADSPMVQMFAMLLANPAMLDKGSELIEYEAHKAVLKSNDGQPNELQILMHDKHFCEVRVSGISEEQLFAVFDQAAVDRLAAALSR